MSASPLAFSRLATLCGTSLIWMTLCSVAAAQPAPSEQAPPESAPDASPGEERDPSVDKDAAEQSPGEAEPAPSAPPPAPAAPPPPPSPSKARDSAVDLTLDESLFQAPTLMVVGHKHNDLDSVPGAAFVVDEKDLERSSPVSAEEMLRRVPGVNLRSEDGLGLRTNIGFRGLSPDRSRNVLVLEDGAPIQLMPYGEPELHYSPRIERMRSIEVVKGASSILYGPRTIGGTVNFLTLDPPKKLRATGDVRYGSYDYTTAEASVGDTKGNIGWLLYGLHYRNDGPRNLNAEATDLMAKFRMDMKEAGQLQLKGQVYDEQSSSTYLGLTQLQYETDPRFNFATNDRFNIRRYGMSGVHTVDLTKRLQMQTSAYGFVLERHWRRQDYDRRDFRGIPPAYEYERVINGRGQRVTPDEAADDGSSIFFRNSTGNRNRDYRVAGLESRLTGRFEAWGEKHELIGGARLHYEMADEQFIQGTHGAASAGDLLAMEQRKGVAIAGYTMARFAFFRDTLQLSPGLRVENLWTKRVVDRSNGVDFAPPADSYDFVYALIPGMGLTWSPLERWTYFAGVHRGFAPPRIKDSLTPSGEVLNLRPEYSWNYEAGARYKFQEWLSTEATGFVVDFSNQILTPSEASGAASEIEGGSSVINSGQTLHAGVESSVTYDPLTMVDLDMKLPIQLAYTFVHSELRDGFGPEARGRRVPYAPAHIFSAQITYEHPWGISAQLHGDYVGSQFADPLNTVEATPNGLIGRIDDRFLLDARVAYTLRQWRLATITFYVLAKNLLDTQYIASRAPSGIQPGMARQIIGGVRGEF